MNTTITSHNAPGHARPSTYGHTAFALLNKRRRFGMKCTVPGGLTLLLAVCLLAGSGPAAATNMFDPRPLLNCTDDKEPNCGSSSISGTVLLSQNVPLPWVAQIAAREGECLRIDVTEQGANLKAVLISPSGEVWRNSDGVAGGQGPVLKINDIPQNGWFTLQLSHQDGLPVNADFALAFGRYLTNSRNCLPAVQPVLEDANDTTE
jgi:hypothetical protein